MDQELWMKALHFHGPLLLQTILSEDIHDSDCEAENDKLNICKFIKDKLHLLFKPSDAGTNSSLEHDLPLVPIELFQNVSNTDRRDLFYKSLDRGSILILQVVNDNLPDNYKLLVLCKQEDCMKLDDLSIIMYLPKLQAELDLAGGQLVAKDLIRAAVCSCSIDERKLYVTLDSTILDDEANHIKLGKISESDLPSYMVNVDVGSSYVEFLHHSPFFNNPCWAEDFNKVLNIDRKHLYSFFDGLDGKKYPPEEYASELKKKQNLALSNAQYSKGLKSYENGNFTEAFMFYNKALCIYPKNTEALVSRGKLYANINNLRKAFVDMEDALKIDANHEGARKHMSVYLIAVARMHMDQNDMSKAQESLDAALNLDGSNQEAITVLEEIRRRITATSSPSSETIDKTIKMIDKIKRVGSGSSDGSSSKKDDIQGNLWNASTRAFLSSLKKKHHHDRDKDKKSRHHHHGQHKSRSKSPK